MHIDGILKNTRKQSTLLCKFPDSSIKREMMEAGLTEVTIWWGNVYGDAKGRFRDGDWIHTSYIISGPDSEGIIKTRNSTYKIENDSK